MIVLWIALAGGFGAVARFISDGLLRTVLGRAFPWATMIINIIGSLVLGIISGIVLTRHGDNSLKLIGGTGFCGGFTTFSTASFETVRLLEERRAVAAIGNIFGNLMLSLIAVSVGLWLA